MTPQFIDIGSNIIWIIWMFSLLICYYLTQEEKIKPGDLLYLNLNMIWGVCLFISLLVHTNIASLLLEIVYISIWIRWYYKYLMSRKK